MMRDAHIFPMPRCSNTAAAGKVPEPRLQCGLLLAAAHVLPNANNPCCSSLITHHIIQSRARGASTTTRATTGGIFVHMHADQITPPSDQGGTHCRTHCSSTACHNTSRYLTRYRVQTLRQPSARHTYTHTATQRAAMCCDAPLIKVRILP